MLTHVETLIGSVDHQRVFGQPRLVEIIQQATDIVIERFQYFHIVTHITREFPLSQFSALRIAAVEILDQRRIESVPRRPLFGIHPPDKRFVGAFQATPLIGPPHFEVIDQVHVLHNAHLLRCGGRTPLVIIEKSIGKRKVQLFVKRQIVGHPIAVLGLMMHQQAERFLRITPRTQPIETLVGNKVGYVPFGTHRIARLADKIGIVVIALSGNDLPMVEPGGQTFEMPFADDSRFVSGLLQQLGESLLRIVKDAGRVVVKTVFVGMLARKHTGAAGTAQGIGDETVGETHALDGDAVEIGRRSVTRIVTAHHLRRMVVGHDIEDVHRTGRRFGLPGASRRSDGGQTAEQKESFFHIPVVFIAEKAQGRIAGPLRSINSVLN